MRRGNTGARIIRIFAPFLFQGTNEKRSMDFGFTILQRTEIDNRQDQLYKVTMLSEKVRACYNYFERKIFIADQNRYPMRTMAQKTIAMWSIFNILTTEYLNRIKVYLFGVLKYGQDGQYPGLA